MLRDCFQVLEDIWVYLLGVLAHDIYLLGNALDINQVSLREVYEREEVLFNQLEPLCTCVEALLLLKLLLNPFLLFFLGQLERQFFFDLLEQIM